MQEDKYLEIHNSIIQSVANALRRPKAAGLQFAMNLHIFTYVCNYTYKAEAFNQHPSTNKHLTGLRNESADP